MSSKSTKIFKASAWLLVFSWYSRILSTLTVIVLARNLTSYDFGILAGCFVVQKFFDVLSNVGGNHYLIRKEEITEEDINAAWTISLSSKIIIAILLVLLSDYAAEFMKIPELAFILKVMSLSSVFIGLHNPAINVKVKDLDYSKISYLQMGCKTISSTTSIAIAMMYQSYWAVVIGSIVFNLSWAIGSQFVVRHRMKLGMAGVTTQWNFSKWVLLKGIVSYIKAAVDKIIVSRAYTIDDLGFYNFSVESSSTAKAFIIGPLNKLLYPSLSEYVTDDNALVDKVYKSLLTLVCIYLPMVFGGVYLSYLIVPVVFGRHWVDAIPLFDVFFIMTFAGTIIGVLTDVFTLTGRVKAQFIYECVTSALFLAIMLYAAGFSLEGFAATRSLIAYLMMTLLLMTIKRFIPVSFVRIGLLLSVPLLSSIAMILVLWLVGDYIYVFNDLFTLITFVVIGAVAYAFVLIAFVVLVKSKIREYDFVFKTFILPLNSLLAKATRKLVRVKN